MIPAMPLIKFQVKYQKFPKIHEKPARKLNKSPVNLNHLLIRADGKEEVKQREFRAAGSRHARNGNHPNSVPPLMDMEEITWPSFYHVFNNFLLVKFIVRSYFDEEFNMPEFVIGAKQAVSVVSNNLSQAKFADLEGLVVDSILPTLKSSIARMSMAQRAELAINKKDIFFSFPYQVGVILDDNYSISQKRAVEIMMVLHSMKGLAQLIEKGEKVEFGRSMAPEYRDKVVICNYRFVRDFSQGVRPNWIINLLNHFKPIDYFK